jgi:glycerophosphoryl diester phosphodiesterase
MDKGQRELYASGTIRIPTLVEAMALTCELDWLVNLDIKSLPEMPAGLLQAVIEAVEQTGAAERVLLSSFDHRVLADFAALTEQAGPAVRGVPRGVLTATPLVQPHRYVTELVGAQTYHVSAECLGAYSLDYLRRPSAETLRREELEELRMHGIPVLVYTVNDIRPGGLADHLAALGVHGIFTDDPAGLVTRFTRT